MSSTYTPGPIATALLSRLAENWWLLLLRGLAAVAFGAIAFFWPGITLLSLAYLWGAYALADGVLALWAAISGQGGETTSRWWLALTGVVSIIGSGLAFLWPGLTAFVLLMLIAGWAIAIGAIEIYGAIQLRKVIANEWWLILSGLVSIAFGVVFTVTKTRPPPYLAAFSIRLPSISSRSWRSTRTAACLWPARSTVTFG